MRSPSRRALVIAAAVAILLPTGGCQGPNDLLARLFGPPRAQPPHPAVVPPVPQPLQADHVIVFKAARRLELLNSGKVVANFPIALGEHPHGPKQRQGDGRTPEGRYIIDGRNADTRWTRELHISYPDARDRVHAAAVHVEPGGAIFIHGLPRDYGPFDPPAWYRDWTDGCIAVGNLAIVKIWDAVPDGTPIDILP